MAGMEAAGSSHLWVDSVIAGYGDAIVLRAVTVEVSPGTVVGVLGPNGAGKTTLLRTVSGMTKVHSGRVLFNGAEITHLDTDEIARLGIAHVPEGRRVFRGMTVNDNLLVGAYTKPKRQRSQLDHVYNVFPRLKERQRQLAETLSGGEQQMLAIGRALMMCPSLLLLDEPSQGLSPAIVKAVFQAIGVIAREGVTTVVVEQNARALFDVLDEVNILVHGVLTETLRGSEARSSELLTAMLTDFQTT